MLFDLTRVGAESEQGSFIENIMLLKERCASVKCLIKLINKENIKFNAHVSMDNFFILAEDLAVMLEALLETA